jgi:hypothetical protein
LAEATGVEPVCDPVWSRLKVFEEPRPTVRPRLYIYNLVTLYPFISLVISLEEIVFLLHFKKAAAEVIVSNSFIKPSFSIFIFTFVIGFSTIQSYVGS